MKNSETEIVKELALCGHELAVAINNINDVVAASKYTKSEILSETATAIKGALCQLCAINEGKIATS